MADTYVYDGIEVKKTGRVAKRQIVRQTVRQTSHIPGEVELVEITPIDEFTDWKKWVKPEQLYVIQDE